MPVTESKLDSFVEQTGELFSLPAVAVEALELTSSPTADARQLKECIERDPALTTKILRVVNSSLFGLSKQVSDLNQALSLLGMKPLKLLVLGFSLPDALFAKSAGDALGRYWQRALVKAVAAREISQHFGGRWPDEAFIAGLLQDVGMLVLIQKLGEPYIRFLNKIHDQQGNLREAERLTLGFDHVELSARLLENWKLPRPIVDAVRGLDSATDNDLSRVLGLAELVSALLCDGQSSALPQLLEKPARKRNFSQSWLDGLVDALHDKVTQLAAVLKLELPPGTEYRAILDRAHQEMSRTASEVVGDLLAAGGRGERHCTSTDAAHERQHLATAFQSALRREPVTVASAGLSAVERADAIPAPHGFGRTGTAMKSRTVLHDDEAILAQVRSEVNVCRQCRAPLSLLFVEIDRCDDVIFHEGTTGAEVLFERVAAACREIDHENAVCLESDESRFTIVLPDCDRTTATRLGNQLMRGVRALKAAAENDARPAVTVSVGVATVALPPRNFRADDLVQGASRCLQGAKLSGGDVLKSIEIY